MKTLNLYPRRIREDYIRNIKNAGIKKSPDQYSNNVFFLSLLFSLLSIPIFILFEKRPLISVGVFIFFILFFFFKTSLNAGARIKKMELVFPDVISLMASNLRSGIAVDRAFILSARPEFTPLSEEIMRTGRSIAAGNEIVYSLNNMKKRINSEKIEGVINLIISGLKSGGNIADLLEETSQNLRENEFIEKRAVSIISMYTIFILFAVGLGTPVLFSLASVLVEVIVQMTSNMPDFASMNISSPISFAKVNISMEFIRYFSAIFIVTTNLIASLVVGLINKGKGKEGLKYFLPLLAVSMTIFFVFQRVVRGALSELFTLAN